MSRMFEKFSESVTFRLPHSTRMTLERLAAAHGSTRAEFIRRLIDREGRKNGGSRRRERDTGREIGRERY